MNHLMQKPNFFRHRQRALLSALCKTSVCTPSHNLFSSANPIEPLKTLIGQMRGKKALAPRPRRSSMISAVYFANWSIYGRNYSPSQLPLDDITHVIYAFFKPNAQTGKIEHSDVWADLQRPMQLGGAGCIGELHILKKKSPHIRILASVGGYSYASLFSEVVRDPSKRHVFIDSAKKLITELQLDGIDLDWEYPSSKKDGQALLSMVKQLREAIGWTKDLTIASPAGMHNFQYFPFEMDKYLSFWNVMTYDFAGPWSEVSGHHAQLYADPHQPNNLSVETVVNDYLRHIPASKLVLGIPLYGRSFAGSKDIGHKFHGTITGEFEDGIHDYRTLPPSGYKEIINKRIGAAYCLQESKGVISYDNAKTVAQKAAFIRKKKLGGAMFWEASGDNANQSLIRLLSKTLR